MIQYITQQVCPVINMPPIEVPVMPLFEIVLFVVLFFCVGFAIERSWK